jgi:hypothetical protein
MHSCAALCVWRVEGQYTSDHRSQAIKARSPRPNLALIVVHGLHETAFLPDVRTNDSAIGSFASQEVFVDGD